MAFMDRGPREKKPQHAPVNPATGAPNVAGGTAWNPVPSGSDTAPSRAAAPANPRAAVGFASASAQVEANEPRASHWDAEGGDLQHIVPFADRVMAVIDNRALAAAVLVILDFVVVGLDSFILFFVVLFTGYILLDRFSAVRHVITLGGVPWLAIVLLGYIVANSMGPIAFGIDYLFMFCGFLAAVSVCGAFFIGRAFYDYGYERGELDADHTVAEHMIARLIEHPDDWGTVDADFAEVEGALNRVRDRQRAAEQALRDESSRKDDLVTYLAHDLKTPLASVVGYLSLLHEAPDLPEEQRVRFTGVALDKAHRLDALIEEFFDITRFDFHDIVLTRGYVDLSLMLAQVVDEFYPTLAEQGKQAQIDVPVGMTVLVDGDKMARVFNNVMKNAIAYSYEGSTIRISAATEDDGAVHIRFENQGDPIPAPKLKVIFEKFYRLDAARATNRGGAGLGLAIAKEIVVAHGGQIACESTPEHTVFTITLPSAKQ
ncbi:ATP-binding protein [Collinsella tanakaei]|uniref:sensor histidine kinase n=1 Tax=Collinsella tanakaei TaxID=626935 RepID=UPI0025A36C5E|nr:ATP-binding protein [Collinsella tanakaei]MDM8246455.1 ATP-binding protein [Collinsella tanakaei]